MSSRFMSASPGWTTTPFQAPSCGARRERRRQRRAWGLRRVLDPGAGNYRDGLPVRIDIDADMIIWINSASPQDGELFERPLARHLVKVAKFQDCPACGDGPDGLDEQDGFPDDQGSAP